MPAGFRAPARAGREPRGRRRPRAHRRGAGARRRAPPGRDRLGHLRRPHRRHRHAGSDRGDQRRRPWCSPPGAYDRPVPFPGWTLPGVMTAGGAQNLMKGAAVLPGRRVLVAGSGPLLLVVAHALLEGGARVEAVCEAGAMRGLWRYAHRMLPHLDVVQQGYRLHRAIAGAGVPFLTGHVIRRALGDGAVTGRGGLALRGRLDAAARGRAHLRRRRGDRRVRLRVLARAVPSRGLRAPLGRRSRRLGGRARPRHGEHGARRLHRGRRRGRGRLGGGPRGGASGRARGGRAASVASAPASTRGRRAARAGACCTWPASGA